MKIVLFAGLLLVVLGIVSLFVPIPHTETHGIKAGDMSIGVQKTTLRMSACRQPLVPC